MKLISGLREYSKEVPFIAYVAFLSVFIILYTFPENNFVLMKDQWRFVDIIRQWYEGNFDFGDVWYSHSEHRKPGYRILFLLNAMYFGLDLKLEAILGSASLILTAIIIVRIIRKSFDYQVNSLMLHLLVLTVLSIFLGFNQRTSFLFTLLNLGGFVGQLWVVYGVYLLHKALQQDCILSNSRPGKYFILVLSFLVVGTWLFMGARGPIMWISIFVAYCLRIYGKYLDKSVNWKLVRWQTVGLFIAIIVSQVVYWIGATHGKNKGEAMSLFTTDSLHFLGSIFGRSLVDYKLLFDWTAADSEASMIGVGVILLYLAAIVVLLRTNLFRKNIVPLFLMTYSSLFCVVILVTRFSDYGMGVANSSRYVFDTQLGLVGCLLALGYWALRSKYGIWFVFSLFIGSGILYVTTTIASFDQRKYIIRNYDRTAGWLTNDNLEDDKYPRWFCPNEKLCEKELKLLKDKQLNLFAPD